MIGPVNESTILGGEGNENRANFSFIAGGSGNKIMGSGERSTIL
jgi:hypothetical protein